MSQYKYKMVNGELVELTAEEIAELEQRDREAMLRPASEPASPPPPQPEPPKPEPEPPHARSRSHKG